MNNKLTLTKLTCLVTAACFALPSAALAVSPPPDGGYPNQNTAEGQDALLRLTSGTDNTALGYHALSGNTTGFRNTAVGSLALAAGPSGAANVAVGDAA